MMPMVSSSGAASSESSTASTPTSTSVDKNMFLELLVAQMRNQDPLNPTDGTQFVAQLAQFQQLEQSINSGQDITAIRQDLDHLAGNSTGAVSQT